MSKDCAVLSNVPLIPEKFRELKYRTITVVPRVHTEPIVVLLGERWWKGRKDNPPDSFIINNLETSLDTPVDRDLSNTSGSIVEIFIKPRASTFLGTHNILWVFQEIWLQSQVNMTNFQKCFCHIYEWKIISRWILYTNYYARSMEVPRAKASYSGISSKPV